MDAQSQVTNARSIGNYGLWETLRRAPDTDTYDDEDFEPVGGHTSRRAGWRGRAIRWSMAAGVFLAYVHHWPGGH